MTPKHISEFFKRLAAQNPTPKSELHYRNSFELLIAVILSAQATDVGVNKATPALFAVADTPAQMLTLGLEGLKSYIKTIGLYPTKANNIIKTCRILVDNFNGEVPDNREALESLPGVGRKTANIILNTAFGHETMAVDTHIFRVSNRTGLAPGKTPVVVEHMLNKVVPQPYRRDAHHWLVLHGRYVCTARKPKCPSCIVSDLCAYKDKTIAS